MQCSLEKNVGWLGTQDACEEAAGWSGPHSPTSSSQSLLAQPRGRTSCSRSGIFFGLLLLSGWQRRVCGAWGVGLILRAETGGANAVCTEARSKKERKKNITSERNCSQRQTRPSGQMDLSKRSWNVEMGRRRGEEDAERRQVTLEERRAVVSKGEKRRFRKRGMEIGEVCRLQEPFVPRPGRLDA